MPVNPALKYRVSYHPSQGWGIDEITDNGNLKRIHYTVTQADALGFCDSLLRAYNEGIARGHTEESAARDRIAARTCQKCSKIVGWADGWEYHPGLWMHYDCTPPQMKEDS